MALSKSRVALVGESPYPHEQEAIRLAIDALPNVDPYHLWALIDLLEPSTGRLHEIDLLIIGYSAIYLVEVKSGPGTYTGDAVDWWRTPPGESRSRWIDPPRKLANLKAKVVKSLLQHKLRQSSRVPWVEPIVLLSHPEAKLALTEEGHRGVVTRDSFRDAIMRHVFPGSPADWRADRIDRSRMRDLVRALEAIGFRKRKGKALVGPYELGPVLAEGKGFQDREAVHRDQERIRRRARTYLVPQQTSVEMRQRLRQAADREATLLHEVREHRNVLSCTDYVTDAPLGPTVLFEDFERGVPLDAFLRQNPDLCFDHRVQIIEQVGLALAYCHRRNVFHGALSPEAVLIRKGADHEHPVEVRLFNFQLGSGEGVTPTSHWSSLGSESWVLYSAPELQEEPTRRTIQSDLYGLGALAYTVLTGRQPAASLSELWELLERDRHLDPRVVDDTVPSELAKVIAQATSLVAAMRGDDVAEWVERFLDAATLPTHHEAEVSPLEARAGDTLGKDLVVSHVLGHGASSRVLLVERGPDGRKLALKVSLSSDHDERLSAEAEVLRELSHSQIVNLVDELVIGDRPCLLLSLAGEETLHRALARQGSIGLDFAARYGADLLSALDHLELKKVVHRDIKPANLGVGAVGKEGYHLTLFDFSLVRAPLGDISLGTAAYRDPFLRERGQWDAGADRWSAAVTLHEMLTGIRPSFGGPGGTSLDQDAKLTLAAERFDPGVREQLVAFFEHALARELEHRFESAEAMRRAWIAAFEAPRPSTAGPEEEIPAGLTPEELAAIGPETLIELLPLSPRARSALDRAGLERAGHLLDLPANRLSMIRGIGTAVAREILEFRDLWQEARKIQPEPVKPFFPGYQGEDLRLIEAGIDAVVASALRDAGLDTLAAVAAAQATQVEALAQRCQVPAKTVRQVLEEENRKADEQAHPSTLEGWVEALLSRRKRNMKHPRALFGLDEPFVGRLDVTVKELAEHQGITTAAVYLALGKCRSAWAAHGAIHELSELCREVLLLAGAALPLDRAAAELLSFLPHDRSADQAEVVPRASALWRVVAEIEKEDPAGLVLQRLAEGSSPWIFVSEAHARAVGELGRKADELAGRAILASPGEVARVLGEVVAGTPLAALPVERLVDVAASASTGAARSARLEIYPRGMEPERALDLSAPLVHSGVTPEVVQQRVRSRYPDAAPLPPRPELDALLGRHGLTWSDVLGCYTRPDQPFTTSLTTTLSSLTRMPRPAQLRGQPVDPKHVASAGFSERLRVTVERRGLRVLAVTADRSHDAALALSQILGVPATSFDDLLLEELSAQARKLRVKPEVVYRADAEGPEGRTWPNLLKLAGLASDVVAARILPPTTSPLLLIRPGLIARYRLESFLTAMIEASRRDEAQAIFLLVPAHEVGGVPKINGELPIPGILPSQALWIPRAWLSDMLETDSTATEAR